MAEKILLNYNDSLLYESDLDLLSEGNWLNDRLIGFVYEYLEKEVYTDECNETNSLFGFVNPSTVQYLKLCQSLDEAKICFIDPLGLDRKRFVFFPLNNNAKSEQAGGSHWSLIVLDKVKSSIIHYDSIGSNENTAIDFFKKYKSCFRIKTFSNSDKFPQQTNSSDCGVYVLAATECLASFLKEEQNQTKLVDFDFNKVNPVYATKMRKIYREIILEKRGNE